MDKVLYFGYVVLTSVKHRKKLLDFSQFLGKKHNKSPFYFLASAYFHYLKYSMHPLDYFYFNVFENQNFNPREYASTLFMYGFHKKLNSKKHIRFFQNKMLFHERFRDFMGHEYINLNDTNLTELKKWIQKKKPESLVLKEYKSVGGFGVKKIKISFSENEVFVNNSRLEEKFSYLRKFDLAEEFVQQHSLINKLNPSCLNTVRVVTVRPNDRVDIIGAVIRLGVNNDVDNFHSGGIAVNIDLSTGCLIGEGFKLAPSNPDRFHEHPVTKISLDGYCLPHWNQVLETVKKASFVVPEVRTVGWDVAITEKGVSLIEGNHDWDKIIIEKALKRGIRKDLEKYL